MTISPARISFALTNSLVDARNESIPTFLRSTATTIERLLDGDTTVKRIAAYRPAIRSEDGAIVLEPATKNEVSWNADPQHFSWIKGSSVTVVDDRASGIDLTYRSSVVAWINGTGASQTIRKTILLAAGTDYILSAIFRLESGSFRPSDALRLTGGIAGTATLSLSPLNLARNQRQILSLPFKTGGGEPQIPVTGNDYYPILSVNATTILVNFGIMTIAAGSLVGAQLFFTGTSTPYLVSSNTAPNNGGVVTIVVNAPTLLANGVSPNSKVKVAEPPLQPVTIEINVENAVSIEWGGIQVEAKSFRTSTIVQKDNLELRSGTILRYRRSPFAELSNFGFFLQCRHWVGDGTIFRAGLVTASILNSRLVVSYGGITVATPNILPKTCEIFSQLSTDRNVVELYLDKKLIARSPVTAFSGNRAILEFGSEGVRIFSSFLATKDTLIGGERIDIGDLAEGEIADLFDSDNTIVGVTVLSRTPELVLPGTKIPGITPAVSSLVTGRNVATRHVSVVDASVFSLNQPIRILKRNVFILQANLVGIIGSDLVLDVNVAIVQPPGSTGEFRVFQGTSKPGTATIRFPFDPIDVQEIVGTIAATSSRPNALSLGTSSLSFVQGRAIVQTNLDQFVAEIIVTDILPATRQIVVDDLTGIEVGHKISQPSEELRIDPSNYLASFVQPTSNVRIVEVAQNGIVVENSNEEAVSVMLAVKVFL